MEFTSTNAQYGRSVKCAEIGRRTARDGGGNNLKSLYRQSLAGQVADRLVDTIVNHRMKAGDSLPSESALASEYGVSRPVIREALQSLVALGIISTTPGRQAVICFPNISAMQKILEAASTIHEISDVDILMARQAIELETAKQAALQHSDNEIEKLDLIIIEMRESLDSPDTYTSCDVRLHETIALISNNQLLVYLVQALHGLTRRVVEEGEKMADADERQIIQAQHEQLVAAIGGHDVAGAYEAMLDHFRTARARFELATSRSQSDE